MAGHWKMAKFGLVKSSWNLDGVEPFHERA
jgi:hypothetical protein